MTSNTLTTNQNNNVMTSNGATLACKSNFTMDPSTLTKTSSNQDKHSTFKEIESPSFITDSSNHLNQSLGTEAVLNSGTLVRNLADVYNHPSKSLKKLPTDLIVDDDLQLGLALSASTQYKDEFLNGTHHNSLLDVTPVLEIDYNTGLLKYPSSHLKKKRIVTQILPVDKAKQIVLQEATDFLFSNQSSLASSSSPFLSIKPSSLPWIDSNSSFWKLSTTAPSPSLSTNNLHSFSSEYAQLRDIGDFGLGRKFEI
ncbi:hypothetical protein HMI54_013937 [Coelomomyces lativittatus]|nr:hypothetical protein HMI54_013937 [Coelomomyces lativittatus]